MSRIQNISDNYENLNVYGHKRQRISFQVSNRLLGGSINPPNPMTGPSGTVLRGFVTVKNLNTLSLRCFLAHPLRQSSINVISKDTGISKGNFNITILSYSNVQNVFQNDITVSVQNASTIEVDDIFEFTTVEATPWIITPVDEIPSIYGNFNRINGTSSGEFKSVRESNNISSVYMISSNTQETNPYNDIPYTLSNRSINSSLFKWIYDLQPTLTENQNQEAFFAV